MYTFENNNTIQLLCINNGQILQLKALYPGAMGAHVTSKDIVIRPFNYAEQNSNVRILVGRFWGKGSMGGGLVAFQFFWSVKKDTRTFNFH